MAIPSFGFSAALLLEVITFIIVCFSVCLSLYSGNSCSGGRDSCVVTSNQRNTGTPCHFPAKLPVVMSMYTVIAIMGGPTLG